LIFPDNIGKYLSIDEVSLSKGELYTIVTNKSSKSKQKSIVSIIRGTLSKDITEVLEKLPLRQREKVEEVTMDMANNMEASAKKAFPKAKMVTDRFHVVKLVSDALQHIRIKYRWEELDKENEAISLAKKQGNKYKSKVLENGDTPKQLLARCRLLLYKKPHQWTETQSQRVNILFKYYPVLEEAYYHILEFRNIFENQSRHNAEINMNQWFDKTEKLGIKEFNTATNTLKHNFENILNFFINRNTNANAESFNAKIQNSLPYSY